LRSNLWTAKPLLRFGLYWQTQDKSAPAIAKKRYGDFAEKQSGAGSPHSNPPAADKSQAKAPDKI
jgi:hypothetical protein